MKQISSITVCKKLIALGITFDDLQKKFIDHGIDFFKEFLEEKVGQSARVTKNETYIQNIISHFQEKC